MEQTEKDKQLEREYPYHKFKCLNCGKVLNKSGDIEYYPLSDRDCPRCGILAWEELDELQQIQEEEQTLYHWTKKSKKQYIEKVGLKARRLSPVDADLEKKGIYVSNLPEKWKGVITYDYGSDAICFAIDCKNLKVEHLREDIFIVLEDVSPERLTLIEFKKGGLNSSQP